MQNIFDLIVIGAGSGGLNVAGGMNRAGFRVLLVEANEENIGGDCLNAGCVPSKALIHIARMVKSARDATQFGLEVKGKVDMKSVAAYINSKKEIIREHENKAHFENIGMTVVIGSASFRSMRSVVVHGTEYIGKRILIATGSRPRTLQIPGIEQATVLTNESVFDLESLPRRLVVVGGGPIGIELGQTLSLLGSEVTILVKEKRILPREDEKIARVLEEKMAADGIRFMFESNLESVDSATSGTVRTPDTSQAIEFDALLVAIGRSLETKELGLEKAGIRTDERGGIISNKYLETTNTNVLVCGDIAGQHQFTHAAELHAGVILRNFFVPSFFGFLKKKIDTTHMSWVTYTSPEIATYGRSEAELTKEGVAYRVLESDFTEDDRAIVDEATYGRTKMYISPRGVILGGAMVAPNAGELVQELILAQTHGMNISHLFAKVYPYPTAARINKKLVGEVYKEKLTPRVKLFLKFLFR